MQESSGHTNKIYAVKLGFGLSAVDINENTTNLVVKLDQSIIAALNYNMVQYGKRIFLFDLCYLYFCCLFSVNHKMFIEIVYKVYACFIYLKQII